MTRPALIAALEELRGFDPGPGPAITFGRNRHVGAYGASLAGVERRRARVRVGRGGTLTPAPPVG